MRATRLSLLALLVLALTGCGGGKTKDLIVGKWEPADEAEKKKGGTVEFTKDGEFIAGAGGLSLKGKYKVIDDKTVEIEMDNPFAAVAEKMPDVKKGDKAAEKTIKKKITIKSISKDEMVITDPDKKDKEQKLVRVK
jgi:hypothetical protein